MAHLPLYTAHPGPGAASFDPCLAQQLGDRYAAKPGPKARTRHVDARGRPLFINRLAIESSPYLLQHAHNPVDWHPWSSDAFALAAALHRPVLLSLGYSTCHWCHVMAEESFEDLEIAELINKNYIAIKVDREERPDIDAVYMACVQAWSGRGGWPMTVWLAEDKRPFFGGTYFPPRDGDRGMRVGFKRLLEEMNATFLQAPQRVARAAAQVLQVIEDRGSSASPARGGDGVELLHQAYRYYQQSFDERCGGLKGAPKFPANLPIRFLLRYGHRYGGEALAMAELTLKKMAAGGIHDQVGGGFHRYSVDDKWLLPHFEQMLYDNARLATAYTEAWQLTKEAEYGGVAKSILDYVRHEMTGKHGAFFAATDADSVNPHTGGREEGWFFTWSPAEIQQVLGADLARVANHYFAVAAPATSGGRSVLHTPCSLHHAAFELGLNAAALGALIEQIKQILAYERRKRPPPLRDEKVIASWNGLMISALAKGGQALQEGEYLVAATRAAEFIRDQMMPGGELRRSYCDGAAGTVGGFLEDYSFVLQGVLDLFAATGVPQWLTMARSLAAQTARQFAAPGGGYYATSAAGEPLLIREQLTYDGAVPAGHSVLALSLARLADYTGLAQYRQQAESIVAAALPVLRRMPAALSEMLVAIDYLQGPVQQIYIVTPPHAAASALTKALGQSFIPRGVSCIASEAALDELAALVPALAGKKALGGQATAYICSDTACHLPVQTSAELIDCFTI